MALKREYSGNEEYGSGRNSVNQVSAQAGKIPPQALEVERAVLGALMLERDAFVAVADVLHAESFYVIAHQRIFKVIRNLSLEDKPIDLLMVTQKLRDRGELDIVGGPLYISELTSMVASAAHIEFHARIIAQKYIQRELIRVSSEIQSSSYDDTVELEDLIDKAESSIFGVTEGNIKKESTPVKPVIKEALELIKENGEKEVGMSGTPSGYTKLDEITYGWQKTDLVIIAARPAMGKTAFVLSMARNMAVEYKAPVALFSLEMSALQLVNRLIASESKLGADKIKSGKLTESDWDLLRERIKLLNDAPLYIDDTPALSIYEFRAKCRRMKSQYDIGCIIVDYLQLMTLGTESRFSREQEVSTISRNLKAIAKEIDVPIIALSQLSRAVESREGRKPQLSDLRESGAIEQDADMVLFIHRPEYYGNSSDADGEDLKGLAEIIIAKHRNGATGEIHLRFIKEFAKFANLGDDIEEYTEEYVSRSTPGLIESSDRPVVSPEDIDADPLESGEMSGFGFD